MALPRVSIQVFSETKIQEGERRKARFSGRSERDLRGFPKSDDYWHIAGKNLDTYRYHYFSS